MKNAIAAVLLLLSGFLGAQVPFEGNNLNKIANMERDAHVAKMVGTRVESTSGYDVRWYRCCWNINPAVKQVSGNVTILFKPVARPLDSLVLDLNQALRVDSIYYHNQVIAWNHLSDLLSVKFPAALAVQVADSVTVFYHGVPPDNGFGSFVQNTHSGTPIIWTLSEPYGASDWWPCKNSLTDKADSIDIYIKTSPAYKSASNGTLVSATPVGNDVVYHWKHRYPIATYLICLAVTNYSRYTHLVPFGPDTLKVINYVYPEDSAAAFAQTAAIVPMIQLYDTLFGIYPFQNEKYGHAEFGWGGGMEHQTMTFVVSFGYELIAHELGHQWFGDKVTCGSWSDIWLNEGFATYLSGLCYEHLSPIWWKRFRQVRVQSVVAQPGGSVFCTDTTSVGRIFDSRLSYAKGALILHQLRWLMGDSLFYAALRSYLADAALSYGFARTADLKSHLEAAYGHDLAWYFNDWYTGEGYPSYHIDWAQSGNAVTYTVSQTQSHPSVTFFPMSIPVQFKNATRDTLIRVFNSFSGQTFTATIPFAVDSVIFDPDYQLISGNNTVGAVAEHDWHRNLQIYPNPAGNAITVSIEEAKTGIAFSIFSADGRRVKTGHLNGKENKISIRELPDGVYSILLFFEKQSTSRIFIKRR